MADPKTPAPVLAWRYKTLWLATQRVDALDLDAQLDEIGAEGWEAVGTQSSPTGLRVLFKRPATAEEVAAVLARPKRALRMGKDREAELDRMREASARRERELADVEQERVRRQDAGRQFSRPEPQYAGAIAAVNGSPPPPVAGLDR